MSTIMTRLKFASRKEGRMEREMRKGLKRYENLCSVIGWQFATDSSSVLAGKIMFVTARVARMYRFYLACVCICPGAKN